MLLNPDFGLVFWTVIAFLLLVFVLGKYAWKPILQSIEQRNAEIANALVTAEKIKEEAAQMQLEKEKLVAQAKMERDQIIEEARKISQKILEEANEKAKKEAQRIIESAYETIENQKKAMMTQLKNDVALIALQVAEKVVEDHFKDNEKQRELAYKIAENFKMN